MSQADQDPKSSQNVRPCALSTMPFFFSANKNAGENEFQDTKCVVFDKSEEKSSKTIFLKFVAR